VNLDRHKCTDGPDAARTGFSLLELLMVLAVIAGLVALAWPNLRKPLSDTPLSQAAANLRELIDECRYQAVLRGELTMLRLEKESSAIDMGSWESLLAEQLQLSTPVENASAETDQPNRVSFRAKQRLPFKYRFALPPDIVVDQILWSDSLPETPIEDSRSNSWYVTFTPSGVSKDVSIILKDTTTQKRLALQHQQGTGLITLTKLPDTAIESNEPLVPSNL